MNFSIDPGSDTYRHLHTLSQSRTFIEVKSQGLEFRPNILLISRRGRVYSHLIGYRIWAEGGKHPAGLW